MCLILFAYQHHPRYRLILAANRDEFYDRPTQTLQFWPEHPEVAAGRDLKKRGTWLGVTRHGRLAAITNYREAGQQRVDAPSRGHIVADFLTGGISAIRYLEQLQIKSSRYNGFNLIVGDVQGLHFFSNRGPQRSPLRPGIYGLSNRLLNTDWPKVREGKERLAAILAEDKQDVNRQRLIALLQNQNLVPDEQLPDTHIGLQWERILAPIFITSPTYGTRSTSLLTIDHQGEIHFSEITWHRARDNPAVKHQVDIQFSMQRPDQS